MSTIFLLYLACNLKPSLAIHGKYTEDIEDFHLAIPHKNNHEGEFHSFHLNHFHEFDPQQFRVRRKREATDEDAVHYGIPIEGEVHHVELWPNRDFVHPMATIEWRDNTLPINERQVRTLHGRQMCYYHGHVRGKVESRAAVATCDGLTGYVQLGNKMYFIEPLRHHTPNEQGHHLHVVYKPALKSDAKSKFCGVDTSEYAWNEAIKRHLLEEELKGNEDNFKGKREISFEETPGWFEMLVVCDKKMIVKHKAAGRDIEQWILTLYSTVKSFYADETMLGLFQPVVVRIIMLEKEEEELDLAIVADPLDTLASFCKWQLKLNLPDDNPAHSDMALLLSNWDFCEEDQCAVQGLAYLGEGCSTLGKNCVIVEDTGLNTAVVITHETGHLIGMPHDEQETPCPKTLPDGSYAVMSPIGASFTTKWSPCSTAAMRVLAESHFLDCFNDEPTSDLYHIPEENAPGLVYYPKEQCQLMLRFPDSRPCNLRTPDQIECNTSSCVTADGACQTSRENLFAEGTICGKDKWCHVNQCVDKGTRPKSVDGGWGEWGEWSECSRTCGRGMQTRQKLCDNPKPKNRGKYCLGVNKEFRICNINPCPAGSLPFRVQLCLNVFDKIFPNETFGWTRFDINAPCTLLCSRTDGLYKIAARAIADGAKCEIGNSLKMCIAGECREVSCDGKFEKPGAVEDRCGVCNGNGMMCKEVTGTYSNIGKGYLKVADVPENARRVRFESMEPTTTKLALGRSSEGYVLHKDEKPGVFNFADEPKLLILYTMHEGPEKTLVEKFVWDNTLVPVGLYVSRSMEKPNIQWSWIEPLENPIKDPKYSWAINDYKDCSALCAGGVRNPIVGCYEETAGRVGDSFCEKMEKPVAEPKKCNEGPCKSDWRLGTWGKCRACQKKGGVQIREVQCIRTNPDPKAEGILQEDSECKPPKPGWVRLCSSFKPCTSRKRRNPHVPAKFQDMVWQQMKKLHLVKRSKKKGKVFLHGKKPTTSTTTPKNNNWSPVLTKPEGKPVVDKAPPEDIREIEIITMKIPKGGNNQEEQHDVMMFGGTTKKINPTSRKKKKKSKKKPKTTKSSK